MTGRRKYLLWFLGPRSHLGGACGTLVKVVLLAPHPPSVAEALSSCLCFSSPSPVLSRALLLSAFQPWWHLRDAHPGDSGTCFFIRIRKYVISVCHWRHFVPPRTGTLGGGELLPLREEECCALTHRQQQRLLPAETQQQSLGKEDAVKGRHTVLDPKIGKIIILSMVTKNWIPAIAQLYCIIPILGSKSRGGPNVQIKFKAWLNYLDICSTGNSLCMHFSISFLHCFLNLDMGTPTRDKMQLNPCKWIVVAFKTARQNWSFCLHCCDLQLSPLPQIPFS